MPEFSLKCYCIFPKLHYNDQKMPIQILISYRNRCKMMYTKNGRLLQEISAVQCRKAKNISIPHKIYSFTSYDLLDLFCLWLACTECGRVVRAYKF